MGTAARLGILCLMALSIALARLVEVEFRPPAAALGAGFAPATSGEEPASPAQFAGPAVPAPAPTGVQGAAVATAPGAGSAETDAVSALRPGVARLAPAPPEAARSGPARRTYVVGRGETLGAIARKVYGTSKRWKEIYEANRDRIRDPRRMRAGVELRIP